MPLGRPLRPPQLKAAIDPATGRIIYTPVDAGPAPLSAPQFQNMGLPESVRQAAADVPSTPMTFANNRVSGGPTPLEALGAMDIPFRAAGDVAYEQSGSPALGALTQAGMAVASPGALTKGARFLGRAAAERLPGALENIAGKMGTQMYAVKPRGGQWIEPDLSSLIPEMQHPAHLLADQAERLHDLAFDDLAARGVDIRNVNHEGPEFEAALARVAAKAQSSPLGTYADKNLRKWIKTYMGTEETDALAKELGIDYLQPRVTPSGQPARNPFDTQVYTRAASDFSGKYGKSGPGEVNEWTQKIEPGTPVHSLSLSETGSALPEPLVQMFDYLRTVAPEKLKNIAVPDALRQSKVWHDAIAKKQTEDALKAGSLTTHREYPTGFKWQEIVAPENLPGGYQMHGPDTSFRLSGVKHSVTGPSGNVVGSGQTPERAMTDAKKTLLAQGLDAEGKMMGHCVGSYCDQVSGGGTRIFSLRDPSGKPHVTVEVAPKYGLEKEAADRVGLDEEGGATQAYYESLGKYLQKVRGLSKKKASSLVESESMGYAAVPEDLKAGFDEYHQNALQATAMPQFEIKQIKGKQNAAPVADYLPYVQDFIKNSPLGSPWGDVRDLGNAGFEKRGGRFVTQEDIDAFHATPVNWGKITNPSELPRDEYNQAFEEYMKNKEGHAAGGAIDIDDDAVEHLGHLVDFAPGAVDHLQQLLEAA